LTAAAVEAATGSTPPALHQVSGDTTARATAVPLERYLLLAPAEHAAAVRTRLETFCTRGESADWRALEVEAGIPVITEASQEEYVPQMVNLDLVGGVSFSKGCYPGQEIVARTHYLGRLKQRMYRIRIDGAGDLPAGSPLYSPEFGADQASGAILYSGAPGEALAVVQKASAASALRYGAPDGPVVELLPLPYTLPD
jgi:tRNA-modifying protein YgfZ